MQYYYNMHEMSILGDYALSNSFSAVVLFSVADGGVFAKQKL
jgi:hypothetical protein